MRLNYFTVYFNQYPVSVIFNKKKIIERIVFREINNTELDYLPVKEWINLFNSFFSGKIKFFSLPLNYNKLTIFQEEILYLIKKVKYGAVKSYSEIAAEYRSSDYARAVGNVCRSNPYPIVIPCHRIVSKNGLGGFSAGLTLKRKLLKLEKRNI